MSELLVVIRRFFKWFYHLIPGQPLSSIVRSFDRKFRNYFSNKEVIVRRNGFLFKLELDQMIDSVIYYNGVFEPETVEIYKKLIRPNMTVFDIGANVGAHTLYLAQLAGAQGKIIAFEPTHWAFNKLKTNVALNAALQNITIEHLALSNHDSIDAEYSFRSQWTKNGPAAREKGSVDFMKLDSYCKQHRIEHVHFIKLDVDGYESKIIRGAKEILLHNKPIMIVEMGDYWQRTAGDSIDVLIETLNEIGYEFRNEKEFVVIDDLLSYVKKLPEKDAVNIVCLPKSTGYMQN